MPARKRAKKVWFGFLEAGERSSPVVRDPSLETGRTTTLYLFNLMKNRIIEYQRDIVEAKLRDLTVEEGSLLAELERQFSVAKESFTPRSQGRPTALKPARPRKKRVVDYEIPDFDDAGLVPLSFEDNMPEIETADEYS
jgi:hypothetical protein